MKIEDILENSKDVEHGEITDISVLIPLCPLTS